MPPFSFTHVKYACAIVAPSVKSVPGCLVTIAPTLIGVPVAFVPGFVPHFVTSPAFFAVVVLPPPPLLDVVLSLLLLPHATANIDRLATSASSATMGRSLFQPEFILTELSSSRRNRAVSRMVRQAHSCTETEHTRSPRAQSRRLGLPIRC